jgi:hypothetical protein
MISQYIINAKSILKRLEQLNSNPSMTTPHKIFDTLIELDVVVQDMFIELDKK